MQRTLKYALATVLGAVTVVPALAQDNFPDVKDNHWAYEALARLKKDGILVGYPDGKYRGSRNASRYELAVAIHNAYVNLKSITDGLQAQIDELKAKTNGGNAADIQSLRDALTALQNDVAVVKGYGADIAALRRLVDGFQKELATLGVDVEQMKKDLSDLSDRVSALEKRKPAIDFSGDVSLWIGGGIRTNNGEIGINMDGRTSGIATDGQGALYQTGIPRDLTVLHEAALSFTTTRETGPKARGTIVYGNMLGGDNQGGLNAAAGAGSPLGGGAFGNQSQLFGAVGYDEGPAGFYIQELVVSLGASKTLGIGIGAEVGRLGYKVSPYLFQRPDTTTYFDNERWDNGKYLMDGAVIGLNFGSVKLDLIGGLSSSGRVGSDGANIQPIVAGNFGQAGNVYAGGAQAPGGYGPAAQFQIERLFGVNLKTSVSSVGINASYLIFDGDNGYNTLNLPGGNGLTTAPGALRNNRIAAFGAGLDFNIAGVKIEGSFNKTDLLENQRDINTGDNTAFNGKIGYTREAFGIYGAYREVEALFVAPGDWGRLGLLRNPTNIRGFQVGGFVNVGQAVTIKANGEFDRGLSNNYTGTFFDRDTKIDKYDIGVDFKISGNTGIMLGFEETRFRDLVGAATNNARVRFYTVGLGYGLSDAAKLKIQYQVSDLENEFLIAPGTGFGVNGRNRGAFLSSTLSVKF